MMAVLYLLRRFEVLNCSKLLLVCVNQECAEVVEETISHRLATYELLPIPRTTGDLVIEPRRENEPGAYDSRELPRKCGELLFFLDRVYEVRYRIVEFHQERHLVVPTLGEWCLDKSRLNDRDCDSLVLDVETNALKKRGHRRLAR